MRRAPALLLAVLVALSLAVTAAAATGPEKNAIRSAKSYLAFEAFSRFGLIQQLSSTYGAGYPHKVAVYAVDSLHENWKAQAVKSAKSYLKLEAFSCAGLIQQLASPDGAQFTESQAEYGAKKAGAC